jgi:hypothetical protein
MRTVSMSIEIWQCPAVLALNHEVSCVPAPSRCQR